MSQLTQGRGLEKVLTYPFEDPRWVQKLLTAALLLFANTFIPLIPLFFLVGYQYEIMRAIIVDRKEPSLPEWDKWGEFFVNGVRLLVTNLVYYIPTALLIALGLLSIVFWPLLVGVLTPAEQNSSWILGLITIIPIFAGILILGLATLTGLLSSLFLPAAQGNLVAENQLAAAFKLDEVWRVLRSNLGDFILVFVVMIAFNLLVSLALRLLQLTIILCFVMPLLQSVVGAYGMILSSALFAMAYRGGREKSV